MAVSSISATLFPSLAISNSSSPKPRLTFLSHSSPPSFNPLKLPNYSLKFSQSTTKIFVAPADLQDISEDGGSEFPTSSYVTIEADKTAMVKMQSVDDYIGSLIHHDTPSSVMWTSTINGGEAT